MTIYTEIDTPLVGELCPICIDVSHSSLMTFIFIRETIPCVSLNIFQNVNYCISLSYTRRIKNMACYANLNENTWTSYREIIQFFNVFCMSLVRKWLSLTKQKYGIGIHRSSDRLFIHLALFPQNVHCILPLRNRNVIFG